MMVTAEPTARLRIGLWLSLSWRSPIKTSLLSNNNMTLKEAIIDAKKIAKESKLAIAVVNAPIENAEDESGPYGYCPEMAVHILYRWGKVEQVIHP
jgi:hypothetical protein